MSDRTINVIVGAALSGSFKNTFRQASDETKKLGATLKGLSGKLKLVDQLKSQEKATEAAGAAWRKATVRASELGEAVEAARDRHVRSTKALKDAQRAAEDQIKVVKNLGEQVKKNSGDRDLAARFEAASDRARKAVVDVRKVAKEHKRSAGDVASIERAHKSAGSAVGNALASHQQNARALGEIRAAASSAGINVSKLASEEARLGAAVRSATAALNQQHSALDRSARKQELMGQLAERGAVAGGVGFTIKKSIDKSADFEHSLAGFGNTAEMDNKGVGSVRDKLTAMSGADRTNQAPTELLGGLGIMVGKGLDPDKAMGAIEAVGKTATATGAQVEDLSNSAFTLIDTLGIKPEGLTKTLDMITKSGKLGGFEIKDMAKYFPTLGAAMKSVGMTGDKNVASIGAALQVALKGAGDPAEAANNARNFFQKMASKETVKNINKEMGIDLEKMRLQWAKNGENPMEKTLQLIDKHLGKDPAVRDFRLNELFQDAQVQNFIKPLLQNWAEYKRIRDETAKADGVVAKDYARMMDTFKEKSKAASIAMWRMGESVGRGFLGPVGSVLTAVTPYVTAVSDMAARHPRATAAILGTVGAVVALRAAITAVKLGSMLLGVDKLMKGVAAFRAAQAAAAVGSAAAGGAGATAAAGEGAAAAAAAGLTVATMTVGALALSTAAAAAFAVAITAAMMPKVAAEKGPGGVDPVTGEFLETEVPQTTPHGTNMIRDWWNGTGKKAPPTPATPPKKGLTPSDRAAIGDALGIRKSSAPTGVGPGGLGFGLNGPQSGAGVGPGSVFGDAAKSKGFIVLPGSNKKDAEGLRTVTNSDTGGLMPLTRPDIEQVDTRIGKKAPKAPRIDPGWTMPKGGIKTPADIKLPKEFGGGKPLPVTVVGGTQEASASDELGATIAAKKEGGKKKRRKKKATGGEEGGGSESPAPAAPAAPAAAPAAEKKVENKEVNVTITAPVTVTATGVGLQEVANMIKTQVTQAVTANNAKLKAEIMAQVRAGLHD